MPDTVFHPSILDRMDVERFKRYQDYLRFYEGQQWPYDRQFSRHQRRLTFNYARALADKVTGYLMSGNNTYVDPLVPAAEDEARRAQGLLREVYRRDQADLLDFDTELDTAVLGDGAYKVTWDADEGRPRISAPDVQGLYVWCHGDDAGRVRQVASRYRIGAGAALEAYGAAAQPSSEQVAVVEVWTDTQYDLWVDGRVADSTPNPYGFIPYVIFPNLRRPKQFWGQSDLPAIMESARELNRALSQLSMILELSGNPIAVLENVHDSEDIAVQPGAVWELPERARAYLLDLLQGGGVRLHVDYIDLVFRTLHDLGESPRTAFGENRQGLSGVALNTELDPLARKVGRKRLIRTAAYERRAEMVLRLYKRFGGEDFSRVAPRVVWGPVLPVDRGRLVQEERSLVEAGIHSRRTAAGHFEVDDPELEFDRWLSEERASGGER
jgi:hypothetical protein